MGITTGAAGVSVAVVASETVQAVPAAGRFALLAPFGARSFLRVWSASAISFLGDQVQLVAFAVFVLDVTHRPAVLGAVLTAQAIPRILVLLVGGVAIDRFRPRSVLLVSSVTSGVVVAALAALAATGTAHLWQLYLLGPLLGAASATFIPAVNTIIADLVPREQVRSANALRTLSFNGARFVGPPLAAAVLATAGAGVAFAANAVSCFVAAAILWPLQTRGAGDHRVAPTSALADMREGFRALRRDPVVWLIFLIVAGFSLGQGGAVGVGLPALAKLDLLEGDRGVGVLYGAFGVGALIATVVTGALPKLPKPGLVFALAIGTTGIGLAGAAAAPSLWAAAAWFAVGGVAFAIGPIVGWTLVQTRSPAHLRGRAITLVMLGVATCQPVSLALAGFLADAAGPRAVLVVGGLLTALAGGMGLMSKAMRRVE
jgi:MFS family permease